MSSYDWVEQIEALSSPPPGDVPDWTIIEAIGQEIDETDDIPTPQKVRALFRLFEAYPAWGNVTTLMTPADLLFRLARSAWLQDAFRSFERTPSMGALYVLKTAYEGEPAPDLLAVANMVLDGFHRTSLREVKRGIARLLRELADRGSWKGDIPSPPVLPIPADLDFVGMLGRSVEDLDFLKAVFDEVQYLNVPMISYHECGVSLHFDDSMQALRSVVLKLSGRIRNALPFNLHPMSRAGVQELFGPPERTEDDIEGLCDIYHRGGCELSLQFTPESSELFEVAIRKA